MSWINKHKRVWGMIILVLLLVAIVGPWNFDLINVPSEYQCTEPFIRLKGDYCGVPLSGTWMLAALVGALVNLIMGLVTGASVNLLFAFLSILSTLFLFLPMFSILLLILPGDRQNHRVFHVAVWGLAVVSSLRCMFLSSQRALPMGQLWGLWLYIGLVSGVLIIGSTTMLASRKRSSLA